MLVTDQCPAAATHRWSEWRYSEEMAGAIRHCEGCGTIIDRARNVIGAQPGVQAPSAAAPVLSALGGSPFTEELRGNIRDAATLADEALAAADTPTARADAMIVRAAVHIMAGEAALAPPLLHDAMALVPGDANRQLRAVSHLLNTMHQQYNVFPDRTGVGAVEVSDRWSGSAELQPLDEQWNDTMRASTEEAAQLEAWLVYAFGSQLQPSRYMLDARRYAPSQQSLETVVTMATAGTRKLDSIGTSTMRPEFCAYAAWIAADMHRRAGDLATAETSLAEAELLYVAAGDEAGEALCQMTRADWQCAPFSSPVDWNFAVVDSSGPSSSLAAQLEAEEAVPGVAASYDEAERLFRAAGAPRGEAAIALRRGYLAALRDDWAEATALAARARNAFTEAGDTLNAQVAATHLLMATLSAASPGADAIALATSIGRWGDASQSFSFALGLGVMVNRLARHWLIRRGHAERALACCAAARALFEALGARINAAQCLVDAGLMHKAVGERNVARTLLEQALDQYTALAAEGTPAASNLRQRVVLLAADVYQLALQDTDSDAMERNAARLATQLETLPTARNLQEVLASMQQRMADLLDGNESTDPSPPDMQDMLTLLPLGQMAESIVRHAAVLAPTYRSRAARNAGNTIVAQQLLAKAEAAVDGVPAGEREMLRAVVCAEKKDFDGAAAAMRAYVAAGGANAGLGGEISKVMETAGGEHARGELAMQQRRTHEQAFTAFVMVRAWDDAARHLAALEALVGSEWWKDDSKPWQPLCDMAELHENQGDLVRARACYTRAVEQLEQRRAYLSRDELKVALASDKGAQYVYLLAARAAVEAGDAAAGFAYAERAKSRALLDLMAAARAPVPALEAPQMRRWREQGMQLQVTRGLLAQARSQRSADPARITQLEARVAEGEVQLRDAEQAVAAVNPRFLEAVSANAAVLDLAAVRAGLPAGALLLEYFFVGEQFLAWAITRDAEPVAFHATFDTASLVRDIRALHVAIDAFQPWQAYAQAIADRLLAPFASLIASHGDLLIVPHGAAHLLPFHVLPFDGEALATHRTLSYLPSASALQWLPQRDREQRHDRILVVGNPTSDLPAATREAQFVARLFPQATLLVEQAATETAVRDAIPGMPLLHFATHGILDEVMPLHSSLLMAHGEELTVYELMLLRLEARLVVLSACSTGQGEMTGGDDVLGLTRALLAAGAEAAVVSLWPVDDHSTAIFMQEFYAGLARGAAPRQALHAAQQLLRSLTMDEIEVRTRGQRRSPGAAAALTIPADEGGYRHPYFWAPFVLVGR
ncbi:MAG: CHAT domain-containing protein [Gemmatimonadota bacterium]